MINSIFQLHDDLVIYTKDNGGSQQAPLIIPKWFLPSENQFKLNEDGSFLSSSKDIGFGGVVRNHDRQWISGFFAYDGKGDCLKVEILAIMHGLTLACEKTLNLLTCETNNKELAYILESWRVLQHHPHAAPIFHILDMLDRCWIMDASMLIRKPIL